jgi:outer membrane receptor protein involved in Fe transport
MRRSIFTKRASFLAIGLATLSGTLMTGAAQAQDAEPVAEEEAVGEEIVVTGVVKATNRLDTSISVSAVSLEDINNSAPKGLSEVFRLIPGVRSESSAGGGNSNIGVRGIPISTGGAKFVQLQEDGLPIMLFGDFDFAPADGFYKGDVTLSRVEAVRGGSASTLTVSGPGAIINLISKSELEGGSLSLLKGIGYNDNRVDVEFGANLGEGLNLYAGGHYQLGGDYRETGYDAVRGGQFRVSLKKDIGENGFIRVWGKLLDKRDATYMPQAMTVDSNLRVTGTLPGLPGGRSIYGGNNRFYRVVNSNRDVLNRDLADGFYTRSTSIGANIELDLGSGITLSNNARYADIEGDFQAHFTHQINEADRLRTGSFGGAAFTFFNGSAAGQPVTTASLLARNGNPFVTEIANFDVELEDMSNFANDLRLSKSFEMANGSIDLTAGFFFMNQKFVQDWHWDRFLVETAPNAALIDVAGFTENGVLGYNQGFGWNGNNRHYDLDYTVESPYLALSTKFGDLTLDASVRYDRMKQEGEITGAAGQPFDVDGDGVIDPPERDVSINQGSANVQRNDFSADNVAYSFGANYRIQNDLSAFVRYSRGASFNGERQAFSAAVNGVTGALLLEDQFVDVVKQLELGVKYSTPKFGVYATFFDTKTEESNTSVTAGGPPASIDVKYKSRGVETEFFANLGMFRFDGSVTYTDAKVAAFNIPAQIGNRPRRQAKWVYAFNPSVVFDPVEIGASIVGTSSSFGGFNNITIQPAYVTVGAFVNFDVNDKIRLSLNANNLFNEKGVTEVEDDQGRVFDTNGDGTPDVASARGIGQRVFSAKLSFQF